jgi:calcium-dependent protein kinase
LGEGGQGEVRECKHRKSGEKRAVKMMVKDYMDDNDRDLLKSEISALKSLDHPNIIKIYECFEDNTNYYIVTELCTGGELFDQIIARKFTEYEAALTIKTILSCINVCHKNDIVHRDLKPENIMLDKDKGFDEIKLIDFGTSV